ncbi:MAG: histidinol dehydrogenase [Chitinophagaceae bacterium]|nr:histidinol dehydrogenase [Chitinophagaceae bacterium]
MKIHNTPDRRDWPRILARPVMDTTTLRDSVGLILQDVKANGDEAVRKYTLQFDGVAISQLGVDETSLQNAASQLSPALKQAIAVAAANIRKFHAQQATRQVVVETMPGIRCWQRAIGIDKVGLYIPGGTAPLFSTVLMLGIPAALAGCQEIILCTPPTYNQEGGGNTAEIHPAILYAAHLVGITKVFAVGGVQAIAAMAYGTESIPAVYKIFGPGNQFVNCAKQMVQLDGLAIDMPAGPSEVCVLADESCDPAFVAADLLSQAEHGSDSQVLLVCTNHSIVERIVQEMMTQLRYLPRKDVATKVLVGSNAVIISDMKTAIELVNEYAPEHLIISCESAEEIAGSIRNAGSVFIGNYSPESAGDYASGTNHTLPTNGFARSFSGVSIDSFVKKITYQQLTKEGLTAIGEAVEEMARAEGLEAHRNAISLRLNKQ